MNSERELFVVSDLHIGGRYGKTASDRGFRINTHIGHLTKFVQAVAARVATTTRSVELVINGDFVDFLAQEGTAERPWRAFIEDPREAVEAFDILREQDRHLFTALQDLLTAGADLTLVLGNHDVELSLPAVRQRLCELLEACAKGRLRFVYDGEAYVTGDVLIEHGNRYDGFNVIEHDLLRRCRSAQSRRQPLKDSARFVPPPGSRLVERVMNPIKQDYGFVDLLKPETEAVIPLLIALEPGFANDIERDWRLWRLRSEAGRNKSVEPAWPARAGQIGATQALPPVVGSMRDLLSGHVEAARLERLLALADRVERERTATSKRIGILDDVRRTWSLVRLNRAGREWDERRRILLDALRTLQHDKSFDAKIESEQYLRHARQFAAAGFRVVLFGHTHLAKEVPLPNGATYINTGTWADLMKVPAELFDSDEAKALSALDRFVETLRMGSFTQYLLYAPTYAHVMLDATGRSTSARLRPFDLAAAAL